MAAGSVAVIVPTWLRAPSWDLYEVSIPCTVFGPMQADLADPWYALRLCADGDPIAPTEPSASGDPAPMGLTLSTPYTLDDVAGADTVIVPSVPDACVAEGKPLPERLTAALRAAHAADARIVSLCTGAFALAEAGLLDGRRATAHWSHVAQLAQRYPNVEVDGAVLYVDEGDILTSAGVNAGLDLCLHLVRRDLGARVANQLARRMVVPAHRAGGQAQFVEQAVPPTDDGSLTPVLEWARTRLDAPLTTKDLARRAATSPRTLHRRLLAATGTTPHQWLLAQRLDRARTLLETTDLPVERIGELSGLGTANNLRHHFLRRLGVSPSAYRRAFPRK
ncbi:GlxA family transcriptional regulator [Streptomyces sp. JJ38]|uniref:GlxA family transcriptional regulator n=1 Tax=Streptomyces sp. JJ38 TaxID=2738128 RepID=UPI001C586C41|nr:helix-turn-helix domain-containing protein [Streptomyces sp. JJ38]MBW1596945.1 helix-turn-helix domain-containing protein [Streptomyces sp. JJ38]